MSATASTLTATPRRSRAILAFVAAAIIAVLASWVIASIALLLGASPAFPPLAVYVFAPFVILGLAAAHAGWRAIRRRAAHPAAVLRVLVPVLTVLSFIPDTVLVLTGFIPGASLTAVIALACMHLVVVAIAVILGGRIAPLR